MGNKIPLLNRRIEGRHILHEFCGKLNSTELMESKFPVEFGFPGIDEFTLRMKLL